MPLELWKAHQLDQKAVMIAYGLWDKINAEPVCVVGLMEMYSDWCLMPMKIVVRIYP